MKQILHIFLYTILLGQITLAQTSQPDSNVIKRLEVILEEDQAMRQLVSKPLYADDSLKLDSLWDEIAKVDSLHMLVVEEFIEKYGWLGPSEVGKQANLCLFMVVQHAPLNKQIEFLPILKKAVDENKAKGSQFALLTDRVLMRQGKKQRYGSQIKTDSLTGNLYVYPIEDLPGLAERREQMGMMPMKEYVAYFGLEW